MSAIEDVSVRCVDSEVHVFMSLHRIISMYYTVKGHTWRL